jgi:phage head maturation protease
MGRDQFELRRPFFGASAKGGVRQDDRREQTQHRVLFQHGKDPQIGDKPLGPIETLREDETGAYYEVRLLDTTYNKDLVPGLASGLYGSSFRFSVVKESFLRSPGKSEHNPKALPERTIQEAKVFEFGPVTWAAYQGTSAGLRSLTDDLLGRPPASSRETLAALPPLVALPPLDDPEWLLPLPSWYLKGV